MIFHNIRLGHLIAIKLQTHGDDREVGRCIYSFIRSAWNLGPDSGGGGGSATQMPTYELFLAIRAIVLPCIILCHCNCSQEPLLVMARAVELSLANLGFFFSLAMSSSKIFTGPPVSQLPVRWVNNHICWNSAVHWARILYIQYFLFASFFFQEKKVWNSSSLELLITLIK